MQLDKMYENLLQMSVTRSVEQDLFFKKALGHPMPDSKDEKWKYTSVKELHESNFRFLKGEGGPLKKAIDFATKRGADFLLYRDKVITLSPQVESAKGISVVPYVGGLFSRFDKVTKNFEDIKSYIEKHQGFFDYLQQGLSTKGIHFKFDRAWEGKRVHLVHLLDGHSKSEYESSDVVIEVQSGANVALCEEILSMDGEEGLINTASVYLVNSDAKLDLHVFSKLQKTQMHHGSYYSFLAEKAELNSFYQDHGAKKSKKNIYTQLKGVRSEVQVNGLAFSQEGSHIDINSELCHEVGNNRSRQLFKGVVYDDSVVVINGSQVVDHGADLSDSSQLTKLMQMSAKAKAYTKPQLEVHTDDVSAMHGATVGQIDKGELFYLSSRGISSGDAQALLAKGFVSEPIFKITNITLRELALGRLAEEMGHLKSRELQCD